LRHRADAAALPDAPHVEGALNYLAHMAAKPVNYTFAPPPGVPARSGTPETHRMPIHDARALDEPTSLDVEGFALVRHASAVDDFHDAGQVRSIHYAEIEALLLRQVTGASRVVIFDHTLRSSLKKTRSARGAREPVRYVHNDYTTVSGRQRVVDLLGAEAAIELLRGRHAVVNVWRPLRGPVEQSPLAVCDARSIAASDLVATDLVYRDRIGEVYSLIYNAAHRWFYYPAMRSDEVLLIKTYDSAEDGRARFTAHTAFDDPTSPCNPAPRESIELRALVFFSSRA
jgi:hypothetical protein